MASKNLKNPLVVQFLLHLLHLVENNFTRRPSKLPVRGKKQASMRLVKQIMSDGQVIFFLSVNLARGTSHVYFHSMWHTPKGAKHELFLLCMHPAGKHPFFFLAKLISHHPAVRPSLRKIIHPSIQRCRMHHHGSTSTWRHGHGSNGLWPRAAAA